jgi:cell division protein FtsB
MMSSSSLGRMTRRKHELGLILLLFLLTLSIVAQRGDAQSMDKNNDVGSLLHKQPITHGEEDELESLLQSNVFLGAKNNDLLSRKALIDEGYRKTRRTGSSHHSKSSKTVNDAIGSKMGVPQLLFHSNNGKSRNANLRRVQEARDYIQTMVRHDEQYCLVRSLCQNHNAHCASRAVQGDCE